MGREDVLEERSQCSSGCQSGWTLYLEHSGGGHLQQCGSLLPHQADVHREKQRSSEESDDEDSMVSDASSGPSPHHQSEEEKLLLGHSDLQQRRRGGDNCCNSTSSGCGSASASGPRSFGSNRPRGLGEVQSRKRRAVVHVQCDEEARRRHGVMVVDDHDLDDTASSSVIGRVAKLCSLGWPAVGSTSMQAGLCGATPELN